MSAFESPKLTTITNLGANTPIYSKGVNQSISSPYSAPNMPGWEWSITESEGDYALSANGTSFGPHAETSHIEMSSGTAIQMNTNPGGVFSHPSLWQVDAYMPDGSVQHFKGGGAYFLMSELPSGTVFAELMLGPNTNPALASTPQTETLAYIVNAGQTQTELFYIDTSESQDESSFGLLLNQVGPAEYAPITREQLENPAFNTANVTVAEVDYQMPVGVHNHTYEAPTESSPLSAFLVGSASPDDSETTVGDEPVYPPYDSASAYDDSASAYYDPTSAYYNPTSGDSETVVTDPPAYPPYDSASSDSETPVVPPAYPPYDSASSDSETPVVPPENPTYDSASGDSETVVTDPPENPPYDSASGDSETVVTDPPENPTYDPAPGDSETVVGAPPASSTYDPALSGETALPGESVSYPDPLGPDGIWTAPTPVMFDDQLTTLINGSTLNDMLDLTGVSGVYELDAGFGSWDLDPAFYDSDVGIIFIGDQYYEFKGVESYRVNGLETSGTGETIRFNALDDINETIEIGTGFGLDINLGVGELSDSDVAVFTGGSVQIDLSATDAYGYVTYTYTDGTSGSGSIRGADIIIGNLDSVSGDQISGSDQRDVIVGLAGDDQLSGGGGDDFIVGGAGADTIDGGAGNDIIVDLDSDILTGGEGRDVFVVNGTLSGGPARITDLDVSEDGLSFRGLDTDKYADRIAFTFSAATLAQTLAEVAGYDVSQLNDPLDPGAYYQLARALDLDIVATETVGGPAYELSVTYTDELSVTETLGKVSFDVSDRPVDKPAFSAEDHVYKATLLQAEEVDSQLTQALLDQIANYATAGVDTPGSDAITLFVGVERADKNAIFGDGDPVLVAYRPDGVELATKFRPSSADEVMLGSRESDVYAHSTQVFVDEATGLTSGPQDFGRDTVVERGGLNDVISLEATLSDLLVGDLQLGRTERGREGEDRSLNIQYHTAATDDLNSVDMIVYKQFVDYDSSFRVEGLELVDPSGGYQTLSLGEAISDGELAVDGSTDAILVGRQGQSDTFTIRNSDSGENDMAHLFMVGFEYGSDTLDFSAYDSVDILSSDPADYDPTGFQVVATRADATEVTYEFHFVTSIEDDLVTSSAP